MPFAHSQGPVDGARFAVVTRHMTYIALPDALAVARVTFQPAVSLVPDIGSSRRGLVVGAQNGNHKLVIIDFCSQVRLFFFGLHGGQLMTALCLKRGRLRGVAMTALAPDSHLVFLVGIDVAVPVQIDGVVTVDAGHSPPEVDIGPNVNEGRPIGGQPDRLCARVAQRGIGDREARVAQPDSCAPVVVTQEALAVENLRRYRMRLGVSGLLFRDGPICALAQAVCGIGHVTGRAAGGPEYPRRRFIFGPQVTSKARAAQQAVGVGVRGRQKPPERLDGAGRSFSVQIDDGSHAV